MKVSNIFLGHGWAKDAWQLREESSFIFPSFSSIYDIITFLLRSLSLSLSLELCDCHWAYDVDDTPSLSLSLVPFGLFCSLGPHRFDLCLLSLSHRPPLVMWLRHSQTE